MFKRFKAWLYRRLYCVSREDHSPEGTQFDV